MNFKNILFTSLLAFTTCTFAIAKESNASQMEASNSKQQKVSGKAAHVSYYADRFHGRKTASGERFNMNAFTVAHKTLPFGTRVEFTCASTGKKVVAKVNDRGPYIRGRSFDLSLGAAKALGIVERGVANVTYRILD